MKQYTLRTPNCITLACCLMVSLLTVLSCSKEKMPEPSMLDQNYFVITDDPNDPITHNLYEFYKNTGIACFDNDTIYKKRINKEGETSARYSYIKLSLNYTPIGTSSNGYFTPLSSRNHIPAFLKLMQEEILPKLPSGLVIPSVLLVDSLGNAYQIVNTLISHGWTALYGFNTVGIVVKNVETMNSDARKMYVASILAGIAAKKIIDLNHEKLQNEFLSISREATKSILPDLYIGLPYFFFLPSDKVPLPQNIGLLFHPSYALGEMSFENTPRESDDIRAFLTVAFCYTIQEFADLYPNKTLVQKKINVIKNLAQEAGFKLPD